MGDHKSTSRFTHKTAKQTHKQKKGWGRCGNIPFGSQKNKTTAPKQLALTLLFLLFSSLKVLLKSVVIPLCVKCKGSKVISLAVEEV